MFAYARLTPGAGFAPDRALFYYAQRLVTLPWARRTVSGFIAHRLRRRHGLPADATLAPERARALAQLRQDGMTSLEPLLTTAQVDALATYFQGQPVIGPDGAPMSPAQLPPGTAAAPYPLEVVLACPGLLEVLNAPEVLALASAYLRCKPTLSSVGVRWSFPRADRQARTQEYHRDLDDWRFLKLFIYLTDVDEGGGPHSYVRGSHKTGFGLKALAYARDDIERRYGSEAIADVLGARGTTFMADTLGIHCGLPPTERPRLILQVQYSLLPIYAFLYAPAERSEPALDAYCNRLLFHAPARLTA
jgi:hypothetical protein